VRSPITIFVHHELRLPWNMIKVWMVPKMRTPKEGPDDVSRASGQEGAADHYGRDRIHLHSHGVQPYPESM